jgi:DNA-binding CsgD family transcriptional regulator
MKANRTLEEARAAIALLTERQQRAARLMAEGAALRDVAAALGVSPERAAGLMARPAMGELVAHYRKAA